MENITVKDIAEEHVGKSFYLVAKVKSARQTSGPTVFELKDDTGIIRATAFSRAGERAFPNLFPGESIQAQVLVKKRGIDIELEILKYDKISQSAVSAVSIEKLPFMIKSENLEKMRELFVMAASEIKKAIDMQRPIVIRHHDDVDGYSSGIALEKAIRDLIEESNPDKAHLFISRSSSRTPYYDMIDAMRDLNTHLSARKRFGESPPLIILCDLGSNSQSIASLRRLAIYGIDFIIIDHHRYDEQNKEISKVFLNPHVIGVGSEICAGALCSELARMLGFDLKTIFHLPALAGTADKSAGEEYESYLALSGYDRQALEKWAFAIDYNLHFLRFQESSELLEDLFFQTEKNREIIRQAEEAMRPSFEAVKKAAERYSLVSDKGKFRIIEISRSSVQYGDYAGSKLPRIAHELQSGPRITMVIDDDSVSFRADGVERFSVVNLLEILRQKMPYASLDGGGHDFAGNIKFSPAAKAEAIEEIKRYIGSL